jgi:hypothetical protein
MEPAEDELDPETLQESDWFARAVTHIQASEYHISYHKEGWAAPNRAHDLRLLFDAEGLRVAPRIVPTASATGVATGSGSALISMPKPTGESWTWAMRLAGVGRAGALIPVHDVATVTTDENRVTYHHRLASVELTEWYVNDERGLEHGFTLPTAPHAPTSGPLVLELALDGDLVAEAEDATSLRLIARDGAPVLRYSELHAYDATGRPLPASMEVRHASSLHLVIDDGAARYPLTIDPLLTAWGGDDAEQASAYLGVALDGAGDLNGDGYDDLIVSASGYDNGYADEGRVYLYHGSADGPTSALNQGPDWDVAGPGQTGAMFAASVASAGDVNGDGFDDALVGVPLFDDGLNVTGMALLFPGGPAGLSGMPAWMTFGAQDNEQFGWAVSSAGDVNGDGYADVAVGAPAHTNENAGEGAVFVYLGASDGLTETVGWSADPTNQDAARFGDALAPVGDLDGDGFDDLLVGAPDYGTTYAGEGAAYLFRGSAAGLRAAPDWNADPTDQAGAGFGASLAGAGDLDDDGRLDVVIGASAWDSITYTDEGRAYAYHGISTTVGLEATPAWTADPTDQVGAEFGATVGPVDPRGNRGVVIGAPGYDEGYVSNAGRAYVYIAWTGGLTAERYCSASPSGGDGYGQWVGTAGDTDGDGATEIMVGGGGGIFAEHHSGEGHLNVYALTAYGSWPHCSFTEAHIGVISLHPTDQDGSAFGTTAGSGDFNGDGYGDVLAGAHLYDTALTSDDGRAYAYYGSPHGLIPPDGATWYADPIDQDYAHFGSATAGAGDVNGDGYDDVLIGASGFDLGGHADTGMATLYFGSPGDMRWQPIWSASPAGQANAEFGRSVSTAGDVNGDGYADLIVGAPGYTNTVTQEGKAYVYHGSPLRPSVNPDWELAPTGQAYARFGWSVSTAGDMDRDGYDEVIVGAPYKDMATLTAQGAAYIYRGSAGGLTTSQWWGGYAANQAHAHFGHAVADAGDVNGDGYADVIVGAPDYDAYYTDRGRAFVFHGGTSPPSSAAWAVSQEEQHDAYFGWAVDGAGDTNGDGYDEVVVGAYNAVGYVHDGSEIAEGRAYVYQGRLDGLTTAPVWQGDPTNQADAWFGAAVAGAGDVNGDGYADVLIGAPSYDSYAQGYGGYDDEGRAYVFYGSAAGLYEEPSPDWQVDPADTPYAGGGWAVATAGDVNGDGFADVLVSAVDTSGSYYSDSCGPGVYLFHGSASGPSTTPDWHGTSPDPGNGYCYGHALASAGDINGDRFDDVVVSDHKYDDEGNGTYGDGAVYVYFGSTTGLTTTPSWSMSDPAGPGVGSGFGHAVAAAGDVDGDGYGDLVVGAPVTPVDPVYGIYGRIYVFYGSATGFDAQSSFTSDKSTFGYSVAGAGDVNADGFDDVIAGTGAWTSGFGGTYSSVSIYVGSATGLDYTRYWYWSWSHAGTLAARVATAGDVNGDGYVDVIVGLTDSYSPHSSEGIVYGFYNSSSGLPQSGWDSPSWIVNLNPTDQNAPYAPGFGWSLSTAGDFDGDGYTDVIIGAPTYDGRNVDGGRAYLYRGSIDGLSTAADYIFEPGEQDVAHFGWSVAFAGDVNGDGFSDVLAGAPGYDAGGGPDEGRAYLYCGMPNEGLVEGPAWWPYEVGRELENPDYVANAYFGFSVASAGDVNGDGFSDALVGAYNYVDALEPEGRAYLFLGTAEGLLWLPDWHTQPITNPGAKLGWSVGTAGDVNGDGYSDIIIGAPGYGDATDQRGRVYVYHGSPGGPGATADWVLDPASADQTHAQWGVSVGTAGDVNGDGYSEVVIGAPYYDLVSAGLSDSGSVVVYHGSDTGLTPQADGPDWAGFYLEDGANYGYSVGTAGDVDGDAYADLVVGIPKADNAGHVDAGGVVVYHGDSAGLSSYLSPDWSGFAQQGGAQIGWSVGTAGDVNGDRYSDVVVGAPYYDTPAGSDEGRAYVFHGSATGLSATADWYADAADQAEAHFGFAVSTAGDVNGDGYSDLLVGARWYGTSPLTQTGRAYVFHGSASGLEELPDWQVSPTQRPETQFGFSAATVGDLNGDGHSDVIIGAPLTGWGVSGDPDYQIGNIYVYYGGAGRGPAHPYQQRVYSDTRPIGPWGLAADKPGLYRIQAWGRSPFGRGDVKLQWQVKPYYGSFDETELYTEMNWTDVLTQGEMLSGWAGMLDLGQAYRWRARFKGAGPIPWTGPWFSPAHNERTEFDFRVPMTATQPITGTGWQPFAGTPNRANVGVQGTMTAITITGYLHGHPHGNAGMLPRYYNLRTDGVGWSLDELCLHYEERDVGTLTEGLLRLCRWTGTGWSCPDRSASSNADDNLVCAAGVTSFSDWTIGDVDPNATGVMGLHAGNGVESGKAFLFGIALVAMGVMLFRRRREPRG